MNGDGRHDILIGAAGSDVASVVYGRSGHAAVSLTDVAAGVSGLRITAEAAGDLAQIEVIGGRDLNQDGAADLVIGGAGNDALTGGAGNDVLAATADVLLATTDDNHPVNGLGGNDPDHAGRRGHA